MTAAAEAITSLERIGHLTPKICALWGTAELNVFLSKLLMDSRDGTRQGLPVDAAADVVFLAETNRIIRAINLARQLGLKFEDALQRIETEDQKALKIDALDDPFVSRDTLVRRGDERRQLSRPPPRKPPPEPAGSQVSGFLALLLMLVRSKWFQAIVLLILSYRLVWPWLKTLL